MVYKQMGACEVGPFLWLGWDDPGKVRQPVKSEIEELASNYPLSLGCQHKVVQAGVNK